MQGHHNPTSFFGPIYNGGEPPLESNERKELQEAEEMEERRLKECDDLVKAKDETIAVLQKQVEDLLADKSEMRSTIQALRAELAELKEQLQKCK